MESPSKQVTKYYQIEIRVLKETIGAKRDLFRKDREYISGEVKRRAVKRQSGQVGNRIQDPEVEK